MSNSQNQKDHPHLNPGLLLALALVIASTGRVATAQSTNRVLAYTNTGYVSIPNRVTPDQLPSAVCDEPALDQLDRRGQPVTRQRQD